MLEQYRISDFIEWSREKKLKLNPDFQRGSVWAPAARVYLIDTILRDFPVPKIYLRTRIDTQSQMSVREVVDGQQRLRTILDFADDKIKLTKRAGDFIGLTYSSLPPELQRKFLEYPLAVEQLLNATDSDVLEVFSRLNSYNVTLNPAEKRHAKFQGKFKVCVREMSKEWSNLWGDYGVMTVRQRVRMEDDVTMAQMLMIAIEGLREGGAAAIDKYYRAKDNDYPEMQDATRIVNETLEFLLANIADTIKDTRIATAPQIIVLFSALVHRLHGIPQGGVKGTFPAGGQGVGNPLRVTENLHTIASALSSSEPPDRFSNFVARSSSSTQTISSREVRFKVFHEALGEGSL